jgi:hypothetical protein
MASHGPPAADSVEQLGSAASGAASGISQAGEASQGAGAHLADFGKAAAEAQEPIAAIAAEVVKIAESGAAESMDSLASSTEDAADNSAELVEALGKLLERVKDRKDFEVYRQDVKLLGVELKTAAGAAAGLATQAERVVEVMKEFLEVTRQLAAEEAG